MLNKLQAVRKNANKKGFTLVELIVVIIIIAILAAVAIPAISSFQDNARKSRIQTEHRQLVSAIQSFAGTLEDPTSITTQLTSINQLAPYMAQSQDKDTLEKVLAKNANNEAAHVVNAGVLTSTFKPANGGKPVIWKYDITLATTN